VKDLEVKAGVGRHRLVPKAERIQVLNRGESGEERRAALIEKYGTSRGVIFLDRWAGMHWFTYDDDTP